MTYILLLVALSLSAVAAWYAIVGLMAIFAASAVPIMVMGGLLEASKLVIASWLYRNWKEIPKLLKYYFTVALIVLMMLTSMGIFGFLSKAHLDQAVPSGDVAAKLSLIDEKIKTEKENIDAARKALTQLDQQVDQTMARTSDDTGATKAIAIRRGQAKERARLIQDIGDSQSRISKYQEERAPIASEVRKVEAEVGPIKYIAELIYGDQAKDEGFLEKAVRIVIMMIVLVFDPLAVLMLIAANWQKQQEEKPKINEVVDDINKSDAWVADVDEKPTTEEKVEEPPKVIEPEDDLLFDDHVEVKYEPSKDWEPELYQRVGIKTTEKELGRFETELLEQEKRRKIQSFVNEIGRAHV